MVEKHVKKCSSSLAMREMKTKTTWKVNLVPFKMSMINKINDNTYMTECRKGENVFIPGRRVNWYGMATMEINIEVSQESGC